MPATPAPKDQSDRYQDTKFWIQIPVQWRFSQEVNEKRRTQEITSLGVVCREEARPDQRFYQPVRCILWCGDHHEIRYKEQQELEYDAYDTGKQKRSRSFEEKFCFLHESSVLVF
ncbi:MAG: hypothetical protein H6765_08735 [Candidatus Peribacteria bacterium]|nr:MAG: hypothetical protein H6765_08735 [Candidatus Peribacteria bacterium]